MMTGTPTENNILMAYQLAVFLCVTCFAIYDIQTRRVPDRALAFFLPFAALAPMLRLLALSGTGTELAWYLPIVTDALLGALLGFAVPLAAALVSGGTGIGGGDIKFCGILGLIYGVSGMALIFLVAAMLAMPVSLLLRRMVGKQMLSIPFLPFLACGCSVATVAQLIL
ncbi:DNA-binding protein [Lacrimispora amygdalina]|uniref:DNA-binding protein n=1 Tax=Lacrimispora amygdalina TaxID=253257 RepID=A0A3E2N9E3_9FIRM|nr:prepilin peptidase [Clostridium indicum]RFZ77623.1 DNA-binding protein [Clostridium indicum]